MRNTSVCCGIDFGTSNSTCAIFDGNNVRLTPLEGERQVLPSALFFSVDGDIYFGREAILAYIEGEEGRLLRGLKSVLGTTLMAERTVVGNRARSFEDILSVYLSNLKENAERFAEADLKTVVMGRPVHFHDDKADADKRSEDVLRRIATNLGFDDVHFQYEPIAAAYAHEQSLSKEKIALVVDLGGGTSDFTVIRLSPSHALKLDRSDDILATYGIRVGGTNFDKSLSLASFMPHLGLGSQYHSEFDEHKWLPVPTKMYHDLSDWPFIHQAQSRNAVIDTKRLHRTAREPEIFLRLLHLQNKQLGHAFLQEVEKAKIALSDDQQYNSNLSHLGFDFSVLSTRDQFLSSIFDLVGRIEASMDICLQQSGCQPSDIELVILTGGSSELPVINALVERKFPRADISKDDKFGSVGRGLAYNAAQLV